MTTLKESGAHLHVHSAFSFLEGASLPRDLIKQAAAVGISTVALTDVHRISGIVTFLDEARQFGVRAVVGAEVDLENLGRLIVLVPDTDSYGNLVSLLSESHLKSPRLKPRVTWEMLERWGPGLVALTGDRMGVIGQAWFQRQKDQIASILDRLTQIFERHNLFIEMAANYLPGDGAFFHALTDLSEWKNIPTIATSAAHYAEKKDFGTFDLLTCIRAGKKIEDIGPERHLNAENYLKPWSAIETALSHWPEALRNTLQLAERLESPNILNQRYAPHFTLPPHVSAEVYLGELVKKGAKRRYGEKIKKVWPRIQHELRIIEDSGFTEYFLVVWDVTRFAQERHIRFAGRGSAADSVVAYCLGITGVDAFSRNLLFERFMSPERQEMPDIDIDFDTRYRDQVITYVQKRYGEDHVARVATYQTFRQRSALREVGKVLGFPIAELDRLAKSLPESSFEGILTRWQEIPELRQYPENQKLKTVLQWASKIERLPRHIGTHLGGVVISKHPLSQISPLELSQKGVQIIQFDKRDVETLGLLKLDLLGLRTFTAVDITVQALAEDKPNFSYDAIPLHDAATYEQLQKGDAIGVFQLESPAQRALALRLQPDHWEDIVASLALIRPGPIKGNMVDPFIARRRGQEPVSYLHPALEPILSRTYGVVLFQEQVIAIASTLAGFTPGEADSLRRVMTHARSSEDMQEIGTMFKDKAQDLGVSAEVADAVFQQIVGYASYGFNEAHAAAFAETAYRTAYLLTHHPTEYFMGLLNAEPLGYYPVDVLVVEARRREVTIFPMDINQSDVGVKKEGKQILRIGLGFIKHLGSELAAHIVHNRPKEEFHSPRQLQELGLNMAQIMATIRLGAWDNVNSSRETLIEELMMPQGLYLKSRIGPSHSISAKLQNIWDYQYCGFGQHQQWLAPWRQYLQNQGFVSISALKQMKTGRFARGVGLLIRPHRPPTRSGKIVVFFSLLDETGILEARLSSQGYQQFGHLLFGPTTRIIMVGGRMENRGMDVRIITPWSHPDMPKMAREGDK